MTVYDVIVIGGGHNGLAAAATFAKKKAKVLLLEKRDRLGGLAAGEEFHPGYRTTGLLHDTRHVRSSVVDQLNLKAHGLTYCEEEASFFVPSSQGKGLLLHSDPQLAAQELQELSEKDVESYRQYRDFFKRVRSFMAKVFDELPPDLKDMSFPGLWELSKKAVSLRVLGKKDMMEMLRIGPMCAADWLNEWFDNDLLKSCLAGPAIYGTWCGPWSPSTNANLLISEALAQRPILGGGAALVEALEKACLELGVDIKTGSTVSEVLIEGGAAQGVRLEDGSTFRAKRIAASCDPKTTMLKLVSPIHLESRFDQEVQRYRMRGTTAKVHLALSQPLVFACRPELKPEWIRTGEHLDELEQAFDAVKYRQFSERPILDIHVPTLRQPQLAPEGHHVVSIMVHFAPYERDGGWTDSARDQLRETVLDTLQRYCPDIRSHIVGCETLTPLDIENRYGLWGGHIHHGEHAPDQLLVRPTLRCSDYQTPIEGLYLCGSGSHPGGGLTCAPGALAARVIG